MRSSLFEVNGFVMLDNAGITLSLDLNVFDFDSDKSYIIIFHFSLARTICVLYKLFLLTLYLKLSILFSRSLTNKTKSYLCRWNAQIPSHHTFNFMSLWLFRKFFLSFIPNTLFTALCSYSFPFSSIDRFALLGICLLLFLIRLTFAYQTGASCNIYVAFCHRDTILCGEWSLCADRSVGRSNYLKGNLNFSINLWDWQTFWATSSSLLLLSSRRYLFCECIYTF